MSSSRPDDAPTIATPSQTSPPSSPSSANLTSSSSRFAPGAIVAGRYRLVAMLGKGGMGEVYRAEDLTLDQPVALKFLPEGVAAEGPALAQFHNELRTARQVSHKNVCRLYDLGEANGRRFLTMEYVDGEDLASLLRRIGRIPHDKAVDISRQLCAGLAAAHDRGVVHRDLKPANVMLDGEGNIRITDFGLAIGAADAASAAHAGTPHYMAPEQLKGTPASVKTDIYALGLVLFEIFTGKRAHSARTVAELLELHESGTVQPPSSVVRDLDPFVERVILRCLDKDPDARPGSALAVAAALPGGDPLAAALAAGETPSPEVVAAAGQISALRPLVGLSLVLIVLAGIFLEDRIDDRTLLAARVPMTKSMDGLEDRARDMIVRLGYTMSPGDTARGLTYSGEAVAWLAANDPSPSRWSRLEAGDYPTIRFWYRTSPRALLPIDQIAAGVDDPPRSVPGMQLIMLDTLGRLQTFSAVPPPVDAPGPSPAPDWAVAFESAGLTMSAFVPVEPEWLPGSFADRRDAWEGPYFNHEERVRVEAASYRGRPTYFTIIGPWTRRPAVDAAAPNRSWIARNAFTVLESVIFIAAALLARRNFRRERGDLQGAASVAAIQVGISMLIWLFGARHRADLSLELLQIRRYWPFVLWDGLVLGLIYYALEPYVRRYSPEILFSWTRAIRGRLLDPRVGRDLLVATVLGLALSFITLTIYFVIGVNYAPPRNLAVAFLEGPGAALSQLFRIVLNGPANALTITFVYVLVRALTRNATLAAVISFLVVTASVAREISGVPVAAWLSIAAAFSAVMVFGILRFGVLTVAVGSLVDLLLTQSMLTTDFSRSYAATGAWTMILIAGIALFGYYASRGDEPLFGRTFD